MLGGCARPLPPAYGSVLRLADNFTYVAHRTLLPGESLVREYSRAALSSFPAVGTIDPASAKRAEVAETYRRWQSGGFGEWRLSVSGAVARLGLSLRSEARRRGRRFTNTLRRADGSSSGRSAAHRVWMPRPAAVGAVVPSIARPPSTSSTC